MSFYSNFLTMCNNIGKTPSKVVTEVGLKKSAVTRWKASGNPTDATVQKIADYFDVPVSELAGEKEKAPTQEGERGIDEQNLKVAFFRGADPTLTDEEIDDMWDDAKDLRDLLIMKKRRERDGK